MIHHDIIIVGSGASGLMASILCKDYGLDVAIIESTDRVGKKILTTGNGRCNISNRFIQKPFSDRYHSDNKDFYCDVLEAFDVDSTIDFFSSLGLPITTLDEGKMYPLSLQASSVLDIFRLALEDRGINIYLNNKIESIIPTSKGFRLSSKSGEVFTCKKLILACGGKTAPNTGSDGSGYTLAKSLGHSIVPTLPALVQLKLDYKYLKALSGVKFDGFTEIIIDGISERKELGEILFTDYGISGPPILQLSRKASKALHQGREVQVKVDMLPHLKYESLEEFLENHWAMFSYRSLVDSFIGIINKKLIPTILKECNIDNIHKPCSELTWRDKKSLFTLLKAWTFKVVGTNSFSNAQVTAGGIDTKEVCSKTLESKIAKNLFFCGEILDVDGDCGGFNLQWAWSSAYAVARSCLK